MSRRIYFRAAAILVLIMLIGAFHWALRDSRMQHAAPKPVSMVQLRALAQSMPGPAPSRVQMEVVAYRRTSSDIVAAGSGLQPRTLAIMAFRLIMPDGSSIVIDSGAPHATARTLGMQHYFGDAQQRVDDAILRANMVLFTHEHADRLSGLLTLAKRVSAMEAVMNKAMLTPAQIPNAKIAAELDWPQNIAVAPRLRDAMLQAVAPGVVLLRAPSHSPGSQMIYVRLGNGHEYLFTGDIAPLDVNWRQQRPRSHLAFWLGAGDDESESRAWLATIGMLARQAPHMSVIAGRDANAIMARKHFNSIGHGFTPPDKPLVLPRQFR